MEHSAPDRASDEVPFLADEEKDLYATPRRPSRREIWAHLLPYSGVLNITLLLALLGTWILNRHDSNKAYIPNEIYSPAQSVVEYETVVFTGGLKGDTPSKFQGSSSDVDDAWDELYNQVLISQIDAETAAKLPNPTTPFTNYTSHYIVELDVFHQLHCLNMLRKLAYPDVYKMDLTSGSEEALDNIYHMEHCIEQVRQSLQCAGDVSTIYWEWSEKKQRMFGNVKTTHTCKNFNKIRDWAVEHKAETDLDFFKHVPGAPLRHD